MAQENNLSQFLSALQIQDATQTKLTFCTSKKAAKVKSWVDELRTTLTSETGAMLYTCLPELARLKVDAETRFEMLEAVRPAAQHIIEGLTKDFLHRPVNLSKEAQKSAIIAQAIQKAMIDGYTRCVADLTQTKRIRQSTLDVLAKALHRAISGIGMVFYRSYQLYTQPPVGFWLRMHGLFQTADYFDLLATPVKDPLLIETSASNIQSAYMRVLLLSTAKLNQVNQKDITLVYNALEAWAPYTRLHALNYDDNDIFYVTNVSRDSAPIYKSRLEEGTPGRVLQINFKILVSLLAKYSPNYEQQFADGDTTSNSLTVPSGFPSALLEHLIHCWSSVAQRQQERREVITDAEVCVGLVNVHYHVSGEQTFEQFTGHDSELGDDILSTISSGFGLPESENNHTSSIPSYGVTIQNVSAGGCCLLWREEAPPKLQSGEIIGIKEKGRHIWSIGVIRWIRQFKGSTQLGVQSLSNQPKPWGAGQMYDMGGYSDYMRVLHVPPSHTNNIPASIITANAPFKEQDNIKIFNGDSSFTAKLTNTLFATSCIHQFTYHPLDVAKRSEAQRASGQSFDDDWE